MSTANARIIKTANPVGWFYTFDRTDISDAAIDNMATAANPNAALDSLKTLIAAMPGTLASVTINVSAFE